MTVPQGGSAVFQPNRALGFVSNDVPLVTRFIQRRREHLIVTCAGRSFHTYGCSHFTLLSVSGAHHEDITCLAADTYHVYTAAGKEIYAWRRGNELKHTYKGHKYPVHLLFPFGPNLISIDEQSKIMIWDIKTEELYSETEYNNATFQVTAIMHPTTYLDKIVLGSKQGKMILLNIKVMKLIHTFEGWSSPITVIEQSTAVDIAAVGLENGKIIFHNLKLDQTLFELEQDWGCVTSISFRTDNQEIMATGSMNGHIVLWDLKNRRVENCITNAHFSSVTGMKFLANEPLLVSSSPDNSLKLWIFDAADGGGRLLRIREGHAEPPTSIRFYGEDGSNILSISGDSSLRIFNTKTETFNKSLGRASFNRKTSKKKARAIEDPLIMPAMTALAAEAAREKDWDNIITTHHGLGVVTTWSYNKLKMGSIKLLPEKIKYNLNVTATAITITQCGNFAIIGYNNGYLERFNLQSGAHRCSYGNESGAHDGPIKGVNVDCINSVVVSGGRDATVKFWPFKPNKDIQPKAVIALKESVEFLRSHTENSLVAVALQDFSICVIDIDMHRVVRILEGHRGPLTDVTFSPDSRWIVSSSIDRTIRVWDIPSAQVIDIFQVPEACISLTFSPTGEFLATAHTCNLGIMLWTNKTLYSQITLKSIDSESNIPSIPLPGTTTDVVTAGDLEDLMVIDEEPNEEEQNDEKPDDEETDYKSPNCLSKKLVTLSALPSSRWLNLLNISEIKRRNKPKEPPKKPVAAPFFLPTSAGLQVQFDFSGIEKDDSQSKLLTHHDFKSLTVFGCLLEKCALTEEYNEAINKLKLMNPSEINVEIETLSFDMIIAVPMLKKFMKLLKHMLKSKQDFELAQAYLSTFLKCHGATIVENKELADYLHELKRYQIKSWKKLREELFYNLCVVEHLKRN
ncbi:hypothetical protein TKK_0001221 [Trichogramma kaykai]|uniref:Small-subunit processome Utp21 domain-containing protein n=1 Tax=Trichogramma kaykai TaxID=54128 RepID=A0ABD2WX61_9HYME